MDRKELAAAILPCIIGFFMGFRAGKKHAAKKTEMPAYCEVWLMGNMKGH